MINLDKLVRKNILSLTPYSSARDEFQGEAEVYLDANENPFNTPYNRYPDPLQLELKETISQLKNVPIKNIFLGNGSDEPIDLVMRVFCEPGIDNIVAIEPTYGMYRVAAQINNIEYIPVTLSENFDLLPDKLLKACNANTKLIFLCSPNNPTANYLGEDAIRQVIENFQGIVVLDEAYIDFSAHRGFLPELTKYPNLIILQTFSKAWGMAALRLGMAFAQTSIIELMNKVKYPYNINMLTQQKVMEALANHQQKEQWVNIILQNRQWLINELSAIELIETIYPSDANFVLVKIQQASWVYQYLVEQKIIVRNRSNVKLCNNCLRITVGTAEENAKLIAALKKLSIPSIASV
ncbi:MAG TPA: histidinol-phosphate transaminase [Bacteroidales bacterium]|nr:histidinol-phosphate transaminase [Bacteroidales bacterium]HPO66041.1 histidinol-phosphate transaminase [Bacteroidales bacterium]